MGRTDLDNPIERREASLTDIGDTRIRTRVPGVSRGAGESTIARGVCIRPSLSEGSRIPCSESARVHDGWLRSAEETRERSGLRREIDRSSEIVINDTRSEHDARSTIHSGDDRSVDRSSLYACTRISGLHLIRKNPDFGRSSRKRTSSGDNEGILIGRIVTKGKRSRKSGRVRELPRVGRREISLSSKDEGRRSRILDLSRDRYGGEHDGRERKRHASRSDLRLGHEGVVVSFDVGLIGITICKRLRKKRIIKSYGIFRYSRERVGTFEIGE